MARGGLVDKNGVVIAVINAASALNSQYMVDGTGGFIQFVPDAFCNVGDHYANSLFVYASTTPPSVTAVQATAAFNEAGFGSQLATAISGATTANKNIWLPPGVTASDAVVSAVATAASLTAAQIRSILQRAATL